MANTYVIKYRKALYSAQSRLAQITMRRRCDCLMRIADLNTKKLLARWVWSFHTIPHKICINHLRPNLSKCPLSRKFPVWILISQRSLYLIRQIKAFDLSRLQRPSNTLASEDCFKCWFYCPMLKKFSPNIVLRLKLTKCVEPHSIEDYMHTRCPLTYPIPLPALLIQFFLAPPDHFLTQTF